MTKPRYPEALIRTRALLQLAQQASYRQLLFGLAPQLLPHHPLPALDTLLYRLPTLPEARWHELLTWLAAQGIALEPPAKPLEKPLVLVDGTGRGSIHLIMPNIVGGRRYGRCARMEKGSYGAICGAVWCGWWGRRWGKRRRTRRI